MGLTLARRIGESIVIGPDIIIRVVSIEDRFDGKQVKGFVWMVLNRDMVLWQDSGRGTTQRWVKAAWITITHPAPRPERGRSG